ncbi:hypothetical protein DSO57_1020368 [Entomophthora muscae]|uniref:Uncharacterized protein n=1 Tax=Entomophthora muscae TaxID=34485 RepID=A0ACC2TEQ0_9FUNG|nr:hypothetical protein DSO57_1020368 [Entomophthora muscae]
MLGKIQRIFPNCVSFELFLDEGKMPNLSHDIEGIKWLNLSLDPRNVFKSRLQVESLTTLSINDTLFSWAISCLPNLEHLRLSGSKLQKATKLPPDNLKTLPSLLTLYIIGHREDAYYRKLLPCLPNLEHIYSDYVAKNKTVISKVSPNVKVHAYVPMENIIKYHEA